MNITKGTYVSDNSDLKVEIIKVRYQNDEYIKVKAALTNKHNGIFYEMKNYKIYRKDIQHWKKVFDK